MSAQLYKEEIIFMSKIAEHSERYDDMRNYIKKLVLLGQELSIEERNLLSVSYKNSVGSLRTALRVLDSIELKEELNGSKHLNILKQYKQSIEAQMNSLCYEILSFIDEYLLKTTTNTESIIFFMKMKGDYYRYRAEHSNGESKDIASNYSLKAYASAFEIINHNLRPNDPIRLGAALSHSVFTYDIFNDSVKACAIAKKAFEDAMADIENIEEQEYKESTLIMQMLRDNLMLWTKDEG